MRLSPPWPRFRWPTRCASSPAQSCARASPRWTFGRAASARRMRRRATPSAPPARAASFRTSRKRAARRKASAGATRCRSPAGRAPSTWRRCGSAWNRSARCAPTSTPCASSPAPTNSPSSPTGGRSSREPATPESRAVSTRDMWGRFHLSQNDSLLDSRYRAQERRRCVTRWIQSMGRRLEWVMGTPAGHFYGKGVYPAKWRLRGASADGSRIWPGIVASLVFFAVLSMELLAGARGYTQGEALWSKGQKGAVLLLHRYAHSRSETEYQQYLDAIRLPAACREIGIFSSTDEPGDGSEGTRRQDSFPI